MKGILEILDRILGWILGRILEILDRILEILDRILEILGRIMEVYSSSVAGSLTGRNCPFRIVAKILEI